MNETGAPLGIFDHSTGGFDIAPMEAFDPAGVRAEFGMLEDDEVVALLAIGRTRQPDKADSWRLPLERIAFSERSGDTWQGSNREGSPMIPCQVNGVPRSFDGDPEMPLLWYLRDQLQLTGTKYGCGIAGTGTPAGAAERDAAAQTFQVHCAMCHGPDGKGDTVIGKSAHIPDLHAAAVQQQSDAVMAEFIANGKGVMPPFKNSLSDEQIHALVAHVRALAQQH